jgi:argininosuccinate lyase
MGRGKSEHFVAFSLASIGHTISKLAMDVCLFMNQNFDFVTLPPQLTTGSSIMPHKKNPDVFELLRAKCNRMQSLPTEVALLTSNLPSGYHRDFQLLKEIIFPALKEAKFCLEMTDFMLQNIIVRKQILEDEKYKYLFTVEEVNRMVTNGVPFRDAYKKIGQDVENQTFTTDKKVKHTHEGSIGNLCNNEIKKKMQKILRGFDFKKWEDSIARLTE